MTYAGSASNTRSVREQHGECLHTNTLFINILIFYLASERDVSIWNRVSNYTHDIFARINVCVLFITLLTFVWFGAVQCVHAFVEQIKCLWTVCISVLIIDWRKRINRVDGTTDDANRVHLSARESYDVRLG